MTPTAQRALGYYGKPRMTRDLDFVVALMERHVDALVGAFSTDFYINEDAARSAIKLQRMFNLMHLDSAIKSSMFETARAIIESSLPLNLTRRERRLAFAKRLYAGELPDAALLTFAEWKG